MQTKIDICSQALLKIGEQPITSFSENSAAAKIAQGFYDIVIDTLLCAHIWRFATHEYFIDASPDGTFTIPSDVLRILSCNISNYEIADGKIIAPFASKITLVCIIRKTPDEFPPYFTTAAITKIAMEFCIPLSGNQNTYALLNAMFENELKSAKFIDMASGPNQKVTDFPLITARL